MSGIVLLPFAVQTVALAWSLLIIRRSGDVRVGVISAVLALMVLRQFFTFVQEDRASLVTSDGLIDLAMGVIACVGLYYLARRADSTGTEAPTLEQTTSLLRETERRLQMVVESVPAVIVIKDTESRYVFLNQYTADILGTTIEASLGKSAAELMGNDIPEPSQSADRQVIETGVAIKGMEQIWHDGEGVERVFMTTINPLFDSDGEVEHLAIISFDISEQRWAEASSKDRQQRYQDLFNQSPVGIWDEDFSGVKRSIDALREEGVEDFRHYFTENPDALVKVVSEIKVIDVNPAALKMYGAQDKDAIFLNEGNQLLSSVSEYYLELIAKLIDGQLDTQIEHEVGTMDGRRVNIRSHHYIMEADRHLWKRVISIDEDDSGPEEARRALRKAKESAEMANRAKSDFLAHMSHELRTPLNAILGFTHMMASEMFGSLGHPKYREYSTDIEKSGEHLLEMINDVLDISKIEAGEAELEESAVNLEDLFQTSITMVGASADAGSTTLRYEIDTDAYGIWVDRRFLMQILINLLTNGLKFTPDDGEVVLKATIANHDGIQISVRDTGIGIAQKDIPKVLEAFGQVRDGIHSAHEGTGLGLPLSQRLCHLHGGELIIESELGVGTTVTVTLPAERTLTEADRRAH